MSEYEWSEELRRLQAMNRSKTLEVMARAICGPPGAPCEACRLSAERSLTAYESHLQASGLAVVPGWQPIESAPKDGRDVVLYKPSAKRPIKVDRWMQRETGGGNWWECRPDEMPTYWMPLPAPPHTQEKDA